YKDDPNHDVIWDLHREENRISAENKEKIYVFVSNEQYSDDGASVRTSYGRMFVPFWAITGGIKTPTGLNGLSDKVLGTKVGNGTVEIDLVSEYGRGVGKCRTSNYYQFDVWTDAKDLRHSYPNWVKMEDLVYNHPQLKTVNDPYYGKNLQKYDGQGNLLVNDTIRYWFGWPQYKLYVPDPRWATWTYGPAGGYGNMYCYRLAETYLLRAEAYFWKGNMQFAANDINLVRTRAGCDPISASEVGLGTILDERARELFNEEPRKTELTRIAFILAESGAVYNGKSYSLENFSTDNFWYDRVLEKNNFYRENIQARHESYRTAPYLVLWPIPASVINANTLGHINQNKGYPGSDKIENPWVWKDGEGEGEIVPQ
ncbi:RagB/SusD family nutrient uptake outer membrane protein, partial [Mariniphaga sediminis]|uniref:RagB/SusD family nutrient uptake outer membrane protein n=1 Tax=Mariniphaga sediminis TaxID=1628158 RepID=UPI00356ABDEA